MVLRAQIKLRLKFLRVVNYVLYFWLIFSILVSNSTINAILLMGFSRSIGLAGEIDTRSRNRGLSIGEMAGYR